MDATSLRALSDELEKIAFASLLDEYFTFRAVKEAGHFDDRIRQRGGDLAGLASQHARQIREGLDTLHAQHGHVIQQFPEGATYHIEMPGGLKAIIQKMGDRFVPKTALEQSMTSTSQGDFVQALKNAMRKSTLTR